MKFDIALKSVLDKDRKGGCKMDNSGVEPAEEGKQESEISEIDALKLRLQMAEGQLESINRNQMLCGHFEVYAYTKDGGKNIVCTICEMKKLQVQLRAVYVLMAATDMLDGPEFDTVRSIGMMLVPNELKGPVTPQEYDLAIMNSCGQVS